jgi:hypothetical protein
MTDETTDPADGSAASSSGTTDPSQSGADPSQSGADAPQSNTTYYYPPNEKPTLPYIVSVTPPPADSGTVIYHQGSATGPVLGQDDLVTTGTGTINLDLSNYHASTDSPIFLELVFKKQGHDDQDALRAVPLADPAPATLQVPATANPGDQVQFQVTAWNAIVYDTQGTGTPTAESDASRISSDVTAQVNWTVQGTALQDQGPQISYTVPTDASGTLAVAAFLPQSQNFPATANLQVAGGLSYGIPSDCFDDQSRFEIRSSDGTVAQSFNFSDVDGSSGYRVFKFNGAQQGTLYTGVVVSGQDEHPMFKDGDISKFLDPNDPYSILPPAEDESEEMPEGDDVQPDPDYTLEIPVIVLPDGTFVPRTSSGDPSQAQTSDPATQTSDPAQTQPSDPGSTASDPGTTPSDPGTASGDPAAASGQSPAPSS